MIIVLAILVATIKDAVPTDGLTRNIGEASCNVVVEELPLCSGLGYVNTSFPNLRGHKTPQEANKELYEYLPLVNTGCSNAIVHLLCSVYAPVCIQEFADLTYPPCKRLCKYVQDGCADTLVQFGYAWPIHLDCESFNDNSLCYGPEDPSILRIPPITKYPDPPQNLAVILLSPSTVEFTWEPPEDSINELFILSCEPRLQQSTRNTMLIARDLTPNTNYTCRLFTAHAINIHNSSATIHFKTSKLGPPGQLAVRNKSPHRVALSWSHPDFEYQQEYLYTISCHRDNIDFEISTKGEFILLSDLQASTQYTCHVALASHAGNQAAITFTTLDPLEIHFTGSTPAVVNNSVRLEFRTNRPAARISCKISGHSNKQDCSNYETEFQNIPAGTHTLRIVAENSNQDKNVLKIKIYVSGRNTSHCAVNLVNRRITYMDNSVMIYFKGTNAVNAFRCSLNRQASFECHSPLFLKSLELGRHQVKITPVSSLCKYNTTLTQQFTIT